MVEEAGVRMTSRPVLASMHSNHKGHRGDHVLIYRVKAWEPCPPTQRGEIEAIEWFAPDGLPDDISPATARRLGAWPSPSSRTNGDDAYRRA